MRRRIDAKLEKLKNSVLELGAACEKILASCEAAIAHEIAFTMDDKIEFDAQIQLLRTACDNQTFQILLRQQPMASDLQFVSSAGQMVRDLERIAEQGTEVILLLQKLPMQQYDEKLQCSHTLEQLQMMLKLALDNFAHTDASVFTLVQKHDDVIDAFFASGKRKIVQLIDKDVESSKDILDFVIMLKYLERIGDHIVSFTKWDSISKGEKEL